MRWQWRLAVGAVLGIVAAYDGGRAELLSDYFPAGVPGYGSAPGVTVASRLRPEFDPLGIRLDSFLLRPQLEQGLGYDDNVFGSESGRRGSWLVGTRPSLLVNSDWSRDSLGGYLSADNLRYLDQPNQSRTNWTAALGGVLAVGRDQLTVSVAHLSQHESRTELDALPSDTPIAFQVQDVRASYAIALNRLSVTPSLAFSTWRYDPTTILGVPTSQAYRNRNVLQGSVITRYEVTPERHVLLVTRMLGVNYVAPQPGMPTRNSTGYQVLVGFDDDSDAVWRYRVLVGWEMRAFRASVYQTRRAPTVEAALIWSPSSMTTVTATLSRTIEDAAQENVVGYTYTRARLVVDHEWLRNLLLQGSVSYQHADFLQGGGQANSVSAGGGVTWLMNRTLRLSATYDFTGQRGTNGPTVSASGDYNRSIGLLTLRVAM